MHVMATGKSPHSCTRCEQKITAYGAVCFKAFLHALMIRHFHRQAAIAGHAMEEVHTKSFTHTA